jgi:hypothetical protein
LFFGVQRDERDQEGGRVKTKVEIEVDLPQGYEATGEFRTPGNEDVVYIDRWGKVRHVQGGGVGECEGPRIILRRIEPDAVKLARLAMPLLKSVGINTVLLSKAQRESVEAVELCDRIIADFERGAK